LYSRFFTKVLRDYDYLTMDEPFTNLLTQGMVIKDGAKMSKSKGNVVDPDEMIQVYGADTVRLFCLFAAPPEKDLEWSEQGVEGSHRFLGRVWRLVAEQQGALRSTGRFGRVSELPPELRELYRRTHQTIKKVTEDIRDRFHFNTAIAAIMELVNQIYQNLEIKSRHQEYWPVLHEAVETVVLLMSPMVPHIADELWQALGHSGCILNTPWPTWREEALLAEEMLLVVQINGKLRSRISVAFDADEEQLKQAALADQRIKDFIGDKAVRKVIVVPGRLVNIVL
jgi:leucyl-tRNA synthetase